MVITRKIVSKMAIIEATIIILMIIIMNDNKYENNYWDAINHNAII